MSDTLTSLLVTISRIEKGAKHYNVGNPEAFDKLLLASVAHILSVSGQEDFDSVVSKILPSGFRIPPNHKETLFQAIVMLTSAYQHMINYPTNKNFNRKDDV